MSLKPSLPELQDLLENAFQRIEALEANAQSGAPALIVTDGTVTVNPTSELDIDPTSITLTNPSADVAAISAGVVGTYTPVLRASTLNPSGTYTISGQYVRVGPMVFVNGDIVFGAGFNPGSGHWNISLPFPNGMLFGPAGLAVMQSPAPPVQSAVFVCNTNTQIITTPAFSLEYPATWPIGLDKFFDGTGWSFSNGDVLGFSVVYYT